MTREEISAQENNALGVAQAALDCGAITFEQFCDECARIEAWALNACAALWVAEQQ